MEIFEEVKNYFAKNKNNEINSLNVQERKLEQKRDNIIQSFGSGNNVQKYYMPLAIGVIALSVYAGSHLAGGVGSVFAGIGAIGSLLIVDEILQRNKKVQNWSDNNYLKRIKKVDEKIQDIRIKKEAKNQCKMQTIERK